MTDERYKVEGDSFWLWQKTEGHCEVCVDYGDWYPSLVHPLPVVEEEVPAITMEVSESEEEVVATVAPEPEVTQIAGLADIIDYENSALSAEEKCQIAQEFYWAVLQILDTNNDGVMSISEFENHAETLTGTFSFGVSDSLLDWFVENAMMTSAN